ncbi:MAG TPA: hypothetical protein VMW76_09010 [Bacteroidales bacterium]|nr:hypothetical protein [Bacteroidales bacterium]
MLKKDYEILRNTVGRKAAGSHALRYRIIRLKIRENLTIEQAIEQVMKETENDN